MVSVDKVYKTVLTILNKEQRGYMTPEQFNRIATHVQLDIINKTFDDYNRTMLREASGLITSDEGDLMSSIKEKLEAITNTVYQAVVDIGGSASSQVPGDLYKTITISNDQGRVLEKINRSKFNILKRNKIAGPTELYPVYYKEANVIFISPVISGPLEYVYIKKPIDPRWAYITGSLGQFIYDPVESKDFELHPLEETSLIINILAYAGVVIKDPEVVQSAVAERSLKTQSENQ